MIIVIMGSCGSGKDTLANKIRKKYDYIMLSPGQIFREEAKKKTKLGIEAKDKYWGKGLLCPNNITNQLVENTIKNLTSKQKRNIIFNGYPRSINQIYFLNKLIIIDLIIELKINKNIAIKRLLHRGRIDDTEEIIRFRFKEYQNKIIPLFKIYKESKNLSYVTMDTNTDPNEIFKEISRFLEVF